MKKKHREILNTCQYCGRTANDVARFAVDHIIPNIQNQISRAPFLLRSYTQDDAGNKYLSRSVFIRIKKLINDFLTEQKEIRI